MRRRLALGLSALAIAAVTCRTPPPLPKSPSEDDGPAPRVPSASAVSAPAPASPAAANPPVETATPRDFAAEQRELVERYAKHKTLSTLLGEASYYGRGFDGRKTASGETFESAGFTAAHRSLPFGTVLRVTRVGTKSVVYVRVNDRGPFGKKRRILDLSEGAAGELAMLSDGVCEVRAEVLERGKK
jgi:rare lipoprotein A (peptidoglycan hydrolase)